MFIYAKKRKKKVILSSLNDVAAGQTINEMIPKCEDDV